MSQSSDSPATEAAATAHRYDARLANEIELRWQARWDERGTFNAPNPAGELSEGFDAVADRPKLFVMDMFPYPSGSGLHVGHPLGYIGTDVYARFMRMRGYNVLHPFGYDAFGLPAEQFALETGQHPRVTAESNVANMRRQLYRLGLGHDKRRELATTDVDYYRWTQWIFLQIFNSWFDEERGKARPIDELIAAFAAGERQPVSAENPGCRAWSELSDSERRRVVNSYRLAYVEELPVNWCPGLGTVLANEEVTADGYSDIGNLPVFRRALKQWVIRITAYAERLISDLDLVDWSESMKTIQRNWIGRSEGARIRFDVDGRPGRAIEVFTTRQDTLPGATYMVLSPEHPMVGELTADAWPEETPATWRRGVDGPDSTPAEAVEAYRRWAARRSDRERQADTDAKTGVFTGSYAVNPLTHERVPIFLADYVLMGYGTGAIMAVPAHDQRDFDFARLFGLPMRDVVRPGEDWFSAHELPSSARVEQWPAAFPATGVATTELPELTLAGLSVDDAKRAVTDWLERAGKGEATVSYRLRDWLFARQRYWGEPFPIVYDEDGVARPVPEEQLPIELPDMTDFAPRPRPEDDDSEPEPPLARARDWVEVTLDLGDGPRRYRRDVNTMPQWAGSCWYYLRYLDPTNSERLVDPEVERYWMTSEHSSGGVDLYVGGVEHGVLHLLYARLWHKILYDLGHVSTPEPFGRLYNQGYIQAEAFTDERGIYVPADEVVEQADGSYLWNGEPVKREYGKMGKSLKNSVSPDEMYRDYGADTLRLYEMSMGPLNVDRPWDTSQVAGVYRFLQRLWRNIIDEQTGQPTVADEAAPDHETLRLLHRTIARVRADFEQLRFNTAIAALIELNNHLTQKRQDDGALPRGAIEPLVLMVAPLAPHVAEELWERLGHDHSIAHAEFPAEDPALLVADQVELPVQVDGKVRFQLTVDADTDAEALRRATLDDARLARWAAAEDVARVVAVPGRIVNVVTR